MAQKINASSFRSIFKVVDKEALHWFPGHMGKGLKQMQHKSKSVDCLIEVHDVRVPISGRNKEFSHTIGGIKPQILVSNKVDLVHKRYSDKIRCALRNEYENIIFTNAKDERCKGLNTVLPLAQDLIKNSDRYNRTGLEDFNIMIIGIPNVGKSSLVNALRVKYSKKGHASPVGACPGITRSVLTKIKISEDPLFYMSDTPGILAPDIQDIEAGLKLSLCATLQDHLVGETVMADYLLFHLNKHQHFKYVKYFKSDGPSDDISVVLTQICQRQNKMLRMRNFRNEYILRPDFNLASKIMLKAFRNGELGHIVLDEDFL